MNIKLHWKTFVVVFITAFAVNVAVMYAWNALFHEGAKWDTTTTTAAVVAIVITYALHRKRW